MKKHLLFLFAALLPLVASAEKVEIDGIWYNLTTETHTAEVTSCSGGTVYSGSITIPESVTYEGKEYSVTSIRGSAFFCCGLLTSITIPEGVTSIGNNAFESCNRLKPITIPESVTSIGDYAFAYCTSFTAITIPEGVTSIGWGTFIGCSSLTAITIPESVKSIGDNAFDGCTSLTAITIPESVTSIGRWAFEGCSSLTAITCHAMTPPTVGSSLTFSGVTKSIPVYVPAGSVEAYKAAEYWREFNNIVSMAVSITHITLSQSSVILIEGETITLTATVTPDDATDSSVTWSSSAPSVATVDNTGKVTAIAPGSVTITATANDGSGVSASCEVTVTPASYVITFLIDGEQFYTQTLTRGSAITLPDVPAKEGYTFSGWGEVPETMPAHDVTYEGSFTINSYTLTYTVDGKEYNVSTVVYGTALAPLAEPVKEGYTFSGWNEIPATMPADNVVIYGTFAVNKYLVTFKIGDEVIAANTLEYGAAIVAPEAPEKEGHTFNGWGDVAETVPASDVTYEGSFSVNSYLLTYMVNGEIYLQTTVEYGSAIVAPEAPTKEGHTFGGWSEMPETMPANDVTVTGTFTAEEQPEAEIIASGTCGDSLTWVLTEEYELVIEGTGAMYDYSANDVPWGDYRKSIQAVSLSEEMTSIGDYAFSNCTKLAAIAIPESVTSVGYRAFYRCSKLATVTITEESQLTSIGYAAFESCSKLTDITIPCGVTSIGEYAFFSCKKLASITCYAATPPTIGGVSTFYSVDKSIPVYVPDYAVEAYQSAKHWSEFTWFIGMETSITHSTLNSQTEFAGQSIYDLHGRRITDTEGIKGIYIIDGRKVIIK